MKKYRVNFYAGTDLACRSDIEAINDVAALVLALQDHRLSEWVTTKWDRIEIKLAP